MITAYRLNAVTKMVRVFSKIQIKNYTNHSSEHILNLITSQIQTVWELKHHITSLLSLNITGVFDTINHTQLLHVIQ